ncbi:glutamate ABC transporter substrate-binding protein [Micrococcus sp.]|uniref:glutamate ABC transporter substrate-binding protein n=1 Tax=Micrococcus sp. TaxID=1271 RepID=UPI002A90A534|nr:glutamate ABC transporter substrate-binding protein [Micrococcus sp.]MDY6054584.1 glutamate ABC transporter substrate-binding protein [Micrococcus sp.]
MSRTRLASVAAVAAAAVLSLGACTPAPSQDAGQSPSGSSSAAEPTGDGQGLRIGIKVDQPGLGYQDGHGRASGFDVDVARYVAERLGVPEDRIEWVPVRSADREQALEDGRVDMVVATYSITEERQRHVDFAGPYLVAGQDLLVRADETEITGPDSLDGRNLCTVTGSTSAQQVKERFAADVQLVEQGSYPECVSALESGRVDAVTTDDIILAGLAATEANRGRFTLVGRPFTTERYGIGLPRGSQRCEAVEAALQEMKNSGQWARALEANTAGTGYTHSPARTEGAAAAFEPCS